MMRRSFCRRKAVITDSRAKSGQLWQNDWPVQPWEAQVPMIRAVAVAWLVLGLSAGHAQTPTNRAPRPCSQSMIVGTWQALFSPGVSNPIAPGFPIYPNFACPVSISTDGSLTARCTLAENFKLTQQPSGTLTIGRACRGSAAP